MPLLDKSSKKNLKELNQEADKRRAKDNHKRDILIAASDLVDLDRAFIRARNELMVAASEIKDESKQAVQKQLINISLDIIDREINKKMDELTNLCKGWNYSNGR